MSASRNWSKGIRLGGLGGLLGPHQRGRQVIVMVPEQGVL